MMRPTRTAALALAVLGLALAGRPAPSDAAPGARMLHGFDVAWIENKYMTGLTTSFDPADWTRVLGRAAAAKAAAVRVFVLDGAPVEGVVWDRADPHVPLGLTAGYLANIETIARTARANGVQVYWTIMDGAVVLPYLPLASGVPMPQLERDRWWNIYNDDYGMGDLYRARVLGPVLDTIAKYPDVAYAIDLHNEFDAPVSRGFFRGWWIGARSFLATTAAFAHARAPGIPVTASAGGTNEASWDILLGSFDGVGLDFLDIHSYRDEGTVENGGLLVQHAHWQGKKIVVGEFGQRTQARDDAFQAWNVTSYLTSARSEGFDAAFAWRIENEAPWHSFYDGSTPKLALQYFTYWATH